jgi:C-terminal processing protease CtpA/Prc
MDSQTHHTTNLSQEIGKIYKKDPFKFKLVALLLGLAVLYFISQFTIHKIQYDSSAQKLLDKDPRSAFLSEVYDKTKENYWQKVEEQKFLKLFSLASQKMRPIQDLSPLDEPICSNNYLYYIERYFYLKVLPKVDCDLYITQNKSNLLIYLSQATKKFDPKTQKEIYTTMASLVLATLPPTNRNGLYTQKMEQELIKTVTNVHPENNLYGDLGLQKNASSSAVEQAYQQKSEELKKQNSPEAKQQLEKVAYAHQVLSQNESKTKYDTSGAEPTVLPTQKVPGITYIALKRFSPDTYQDFEKTIQKLNTTDTALVIDLRGNIGGAIDQTSNFLGDFLGKNKFAFNFLHQGDNQTFYTTADKSPYLSNYKQVVFLTDGQTQSTGELMSASAKRFKLGTLVGTTTKGWGTVEQVFQIEHQIDTSEKFSIFLVHSLTLREDNQPVEGKGVDPDINIKNPNWQAQFMKVYNNQVLLNYVEGLLKS